MLSTIWDMLGKEIFVLLLPVTTIFVLALSVKKNLFEQSMKYRDPNFSCFHSYLFEITFYFPAANILKYAPEDSAALRDSVK